MLTSSSNPARYFLVPGAIGTVPVSPGTVTVNISITDGDLVTGTDVTENQNLLTQNQAMQPLLLPSAIFTYSSRLGYVAIDSAGVSPSPTSLTRTITSTSRRGSTRFTLEGRQIPIQGVSISATLFIATLSGLYSSSDNGGQPVTWTPPARVDGSVGILAPSCILSSNGRILVASEKGLFSYASGTFPSIPLSYWQTPDWSRINWSAPTQVQVVVDDALDRVIRVTAPLTVLVTAASNTSPITITTGVLVNGQVDAQPHLMTTGITVTIAGVGGNTAANTTAVITVTGPNTFTIPVAGNGAYTSGGVVTPAEPTVEMAWNYSSGEQPGMPYSINAFTAYRATASGMIRNIANGYDEVWYAPGASNPGGTHKANAAARPVYPSRRGYERRGGGHILAAGDWHLPRLPGHDGHAPRLRRGGTSAFMAPALALTAFGIRSCGIDYACRRFSPLALVSKPGTGDTG